MSPTRSSPILLAAFATFATFATLATTSGVARAAEQLAATAPTRAPWNFGFRLAMMFPIGDAGAESDYASGLDLTYWHERDGYAVEPRLGFRVDGDFWQDGGWKSVAADVGVYALHRVGRATVFAGGGAGLRYFSERTYETFRTGTVLIVEHKLLHADARIAPAAFARIGWLSAPSKDDGVSRLVLALEVDAAYTTLNGKPNPRSFQLSLGVVF